MRRVLMAGMVAAASTACSDDALRTPAQPETISAPLRIESAQHAGTPHNHSVHLSGDEENPPVDTTAQGQAIFHVAGSSVEYKLIASNIENVNQGHIHCGATGVNGPVVVWLYPSAPPAVLIPGRHDGILAEGTFTNANVIARPNSSACPGGVANLADVLAKIRSGNAYVNVHTTANPGGEIRGQFQVRGPQN